MLKRLAIGADSTAHAGETWRRSLAFNCYFSFCEIKWLILWNRFFVILPTPTVHSHKRIEAFYKQTPSCSTKKCQAQVSLVLEQLGTPQKAQVLFHSVPFHLPLSQSCVMKYAFAFMLGSKVNTQNQRNSLFPLPVPVVKPASSLFSSVLCSG